MNDTTWFWQIIDAHGLADVSSDEVAALKELVAKAARATTAESERDELLREKDRLEAALEPFAGYYGPHYPDTDNRGVPLPDEDGVGWIYLNVGDFRRARAALPSAPTEETRP